MVGPKTLIFTRDDSIFRGLSAFPVGEFGYATNKNPDGCSGSRSICPDR